jgi:hypothetical protein
MLKKKKPIQEERVVVWALAIFGKAHMGPMYGVFPSAVVLGQVVYYMVSVLGSGYVSDLAVSKNTLTFSSGVPTYGGGFRGMEVWGLRNLSLRSSGIGVWGFMWVWGFGYVI